MSARHRERGLSRRKHISHKLRGPSAKSSGNDQIDTILDNIGLPYSGINIALSDTATVGPMDGESLSLSTRNTPQPLRHIADLRRELPRLFPQLQFFFQPADIVNQVLNFGSLHRSTFAYPVRKIRQPTGQLPSSPAT